jgi:hypothetical protein
VSFEDLVPERVIKGFFIRVVAKWVILEFETVGNAGSVRDSFAYTI